MILARDLGPRVCQGSGLGFGASGLKQLQAYKSHGVTGFCKQGFWLQDAADKETRTPRTI